MKNLVQEDGGPSMAPSASRVTGRPAQGETAGVVLNSKWVECTRGCVGLPVWGGDRPISPKP